MSRFKKLGPVLKLVLCISVLPTLLILWPVIGILRSVVDGAAYGFLSAVMATFKVVDGGKTNKLYHCFYDGTVDPFKACFTIVRDVKDVCHHSYFSVMNNLLEQGPPSGKYYGIRILYLPGAVIAGILGFIVDLPEISSIALFKNLYVLFKGWRRLFYNLSGWEGPFLETICVPFPGLAILLWPLAVVRAVLVSIVASVFLGAFAAVVIYYVRNPLSSLAFAILLPPLPYIMNTAMLFLICLKNLVCRGFNLALRYFNISDVHLTHSSYIFNKSTRSPSISRHSLS